MKTLITISIAGFLVVLSFIGIGKFNSYPIFYNHSGQCTAKTVRIYSDTTTPTTSNGFSIDISSAGFSSISSVGINPVLNTATIANMPIVVVKSISNTTIVVNLLTQNNATVSILSINVLSGAPMVFDASLTGVVLQVQVIGN